MHHRNKKIKKCIEKIYFEGDENLDRRKIRFCFGKRYILSCEWKTMFVIIRIFLSFKVFYIICYMKFIKKRKRFISVYFLKEVKSKGYGTLVPRAVIKYNEKENALAMRLGLRLNFYKQICNAEQRFKVH